ncbi:MAG TPA: efflux RND transporter periplasmic adaptor subunit [Membranihabitans sp.]|nr:efflux RND transporter periplasmic adaptor subunit [Membranihabitans sp.]
MKHHRYRRIILYGTLILLAGCQNPDSASDNPGDINQMDLAELKAIYQVKTQEKQILDKELQAIQARIAELDPSIQTRQSQRVTVYPVEHTVFNQYIKSQGLLEADEVIQVNAEASGRLIKLHIKEGDYVDKGDLVAELDLEQVNKQMAELQTSYELAQEIFERQKRLWDQNIGSELQFLQAKNEKERLEKSMETLEFQLTKGRIYAPLAGVVDQLNILEGELVSPGASIAVILDIRQFVATADIAENYLAHVGQGDQVTVFFPSLNAETKGRISYIGNTIDKANRTFRIEVKVNKFVKNLKPNMLVEIQLTTQTIEDVITVPVNLIQQEINGREFLMVVDQSQGNPVARKTYITKTETNDEMAVITEGLKPGDEVIEVGGRTVSDGTPLEIIELSVLSESTNQPSND